MARRKQHLKYQVKKGRINKTTEGTADDRRADGSAIGVAEKGLAPTVKKMTSKSSVEKTKEFTKLPETETKFIRKEIIYILSVAAFLGLVYVVIYFVFKNTGLDEWLSSFIRLNK